MMRSGFRIGRMFGIDIHLDWSLLFIFLLVLWNLGAVFTETHPEWGSLNWIIAAIAALLFFASILAHELAHSLMAIAQGLPVRNITLFLFGGVSNIERDPPSPRAEFLITVVGPLTSIVLGALLIGLASLIAPVQIGTGGPTEFLARLGPVTTLLLWLGPINILLGIFNLVPGFPLDGGRILRSILWAATDNLRRATRWASWVGQGVAWLFIVTGIAMAFGAEVPILGSGFISGLWLAFIGWFLNTAAVQSYQQVVIQDVLEDVPVARLMRSDVVQVPPDLLVSALAYDQIIGTNRRSFIVEDGEQLVGLVTLEDVRKVPREAWDSTTIQQVMTPASELVIISPEEEAAEALRLLAERDIRQVPVVQGGRVVGLVRRQDIMRWLQLHSELARG